MEVAIWAVWLLGSLAAGVLLGRRIRALVVGDGDEYGDDDKYLVRWLIVLSPFLVGLMFLVLVCVLGERYSEAGLVARARPLFARLADAAGTAPDRVRAVFEKLGV